MIITGDRGEEWNGEVMCSINQAMGVVLSLLMSDNNTCDIQLECSTHRKS